MAEIIKEEQKKLEVKEEIVSIQEEILPSPTVEDTCTVYIKEYILPFSSVEDTCMLRKKILR